MKDTTTAKSTQLAEENTNHTSTETRYEPPERDGVFWGGNERNVENLRVIGQIGSCCGIDIESNTIAWIISGLNPYLSTHEGEKIDIPNTYKHWEDEFGNGNGLYRGKFVKKEDEVVQFGLTSKRTMAAMKALTGGGRFDSSKYELYDCLPVPILRGPEGAIAIAPVEIRKK